MISATRLVHARVACAALLTALALLVRARPAAADEPGATASAARAADQSSDASQRAAADAPHTPVVLARFSTGYAHDAEHKARASNIEIAAEAIHGKTIAPGGVFSFNDAVGERTAAFGYARSVVIRDGMIAEGMGGGACQVVSTLHAAALLAGLDVVARAPHSRPSAYIRMGLDATVAFGGTSPAIDLKLKNPYASAVTIYARATRGSLDVWLDTRAASRPDVSLTSEILERSPFQRVVERDKRAKDDVVRMKAFGIPGYRVRRVREIRAADGTVQRDVRIDVYPATSEVVQVSPSFDEARLRARTAGAGADEPDDEPADRDAIAPRVVVDASAMRPVLVQLRPSTRVTLDNSAR